MELAKGTLSDIVWLRLLKEQEWGNPDPKITNEVSSTARKAILYQVLHGLSYLKSRRLIHRDLKPDSVLLTSVGTAKLCDFGLSVPVPEGQDSLVIKDPRGTPEFMAPELFCQVQRIDYGTDIWAFGMMICSSYSRGKTFLTGGAERFLPEHWEAYRKGNNHYFHKFIGYASVELEWLYTALGRKRSSTYEKTYSILRRSMEAVLEKIKRCLVPYADRGPVDPIERGDLLRRMGVDAS